jgi:hypothetical protein
MFCVARSRSDLDVQTMKHGKAEQPTTFPLSPPDGFDFDGSLACWLR